MTVLRPDVLTLLTALTALTGFPGGATAAPPETESRPIACTLSSAEKRERAAAIRRDLLPRVKTVTETVTGYVLVFDRAEGELERIASFVELESQCCAFLDFAIRIDSGGDTIALELAGPEGTKELLRPLVEGRSNGS
jgi:hypothetical protein